MFMSFAVAVLLLAPNSTGTGSGLEFTKPSESYAFVHQPMEEWEAAVRAGQRPRTNVAPKDEVHRRAKTWCPAFAVENQSGEELYFLALLCRDALNWPKARAAIEQYLTDKQQPHGPEARLLLAAVEVSMSELDKSWQTLRTVLEKDPIGSEQSTMMDSLIEGEADKDEATALVWAKERYSALVDRAKSPIPNAPTISYQWVVFAGIDLVHRYYLFGKSDEAQRVLAEVNGFKEAHQSDVRGWASESLHWANMEMHPAPPIPVRKLLSNASVSELIRKGRVEVVSFFFLGCAPCMSELPALNDLQKRYRKKGVLVADVTTYEANSSVEPPTHSAIETALNKTRLKKAPDLRMVITSDEAIANYGVVGFPVVAVIDKGGRVRYMGREIDFDEGEPVSRLIRRLTDE